MIERRLYHHLDWLLVAAVVALCAVGVLMIYATTGDPARGTPSRLYLTQIYAIAIGLVAVLLVLFVLDWWLKIFDPIRAILFGG